MTWAISLEALNLKNHEPQTLKNQMLNVEIIKNIYHGKKN
jgi:hypothetical protein